MASLAAARDSEGDAPGIGAMRLMHWVDRIDKSLATRPGLWLLGFTLIYLGAAIAGSESKPLWFDEIFTFYISSQPHFRDVLGAVRFDSHPPLSFLLTHVSQLLFGTGDLATRLPETVGFWLVCLCLYLFVRRRTRPVFALLAATIPAATSCFSYAFEARPYALVLGFAGVALISWQAAIKGSRRYVGLSGLTLSLAAALCCHYYAVLEIVFPLAVGEAVRTVLRRRVDWSVWAAFAISLLPLIWLWPGASSASAVFAEHIRTSPVFWAKPTPLRLFDFYSELLTHAVLPTVIALGCAALAGLIPGFSSLTRSEQAATKHLVHEAAAHETAAAIGFLLVPILLLLFTRLRTGYFMDRYALTAVLGVAILAAYLFSTVWARASASVFILVFVLSATGLRSLNVLRLLGNLRGHAASIYSPGMLSGMDAMPGELPVVVSNPLVFVQTARYAKPESVSRMVYLTDVRTAFEQADPLPEYSLYVARPILTGHTEEYAQFLNEHKQFWLYYSGNPGMEWLPAKLIAAGWELRAVKQQGNATIFRVTRLRA